MVSQFACSKELWITAYNFSRVILFCRIREINIVPQYLQYTFRRKCSANKCTQCVKSLSCFVFIINLFPFVEKFKWRVCRTQSIFCTVANYRQCTIFQQYRNIPHIACANLRMRIAYSSVLFGRVFQLDNTDGYAVYEKQYVRTAIFTSLFHNKLIDTTENIMVGMLKVDIFQTKRIIPTIAICKVITVTIKQKSIPESVIVILTAYIAQIGDNAVHLGGCQILILVLISKKTS